MDYNREVIKDKRTGESYVKIKHSSGLNILIWEMPGFTTSHALFGTKYGSINTRFKTSKNDDFIEVPEGIAHFLEHKLFENEDCDVFDLYAPTGANANAYTTFDHTAYLFSTSGDYKKPLEILLNFVQKPYFTQQTVDKEQGIIAQEIKMCNDSPDRKCYFNLLKSMYKNHPVKIDIAGTVESISKINADLLYDCYNTFYNLNNMVLSIAGNVNEETVLEICDECLIPAKDQKLECDFKDEPNEIYQKEIVEHFEVGQPIFYIGFKAKPCNGKDMVKKEIVGNILMQMMFGNISNLYKDLIDEQLITSPLSYEVFDTTGVMSCIIGGESKNPKAIFDKCIQTIKDAKKNGLDRQQFEMLKKSKFGSIIRGFNNVENCAELMMNSYFAGVNAFSVCEEYAKLTYDDCMKELEIMFDTENVSISIIDNK